MCHRYERRVQSAQREEPSLRVPPLMPPRLRNRAIGAAVTAVLAVVAAFALPDLVAAQTASARPAEKPRAAAPAPATKAATTVTPVAVAPQPAQAARDSKGKRGAAMVDDEVPSWTGDKSSGGGCHH